jgi:hypothetical protein
MTEQHKAIDIEEAEMTLEDHLSDVTADLLSAKGNETFLRQLFSAKAGTWSLVLPICQEMRELARRLQQLEVDAEARLFVSWLEYPGGIVEDFATVVFFMESLDWHTVAVFNRHFVPPAE